MKKLLYIMVVLCFWACDDPEAGDCFQTSGKTVVKEISVSSFDSITTYPGIQLKIQQGNTFTVEVKTGENLFNDIEVRLENNHLILKNNNDCNWVRDYNSTEVIVTTPYLSYIRNGSQFKVYSEQMLNFNNLKLISENNNKTDVYASGNFDLKLNSTTISISTNNLSAFFLRGTTENLNVSVYNSDSRVEAQNLIAQNVSIYHRGSNKIIVNPQQSLTGKLVSTGDLIAKNQPPEVSIEELYTGNLIFE